ncbi:MAG: hypothetical protein KUG78_00280, partial [Kangiellaceae bacterium]|nr:hypothetical protein [Kangiellaceae bacterium]
MHRYIIQFSVASVLLAIVACGGSKPALISTSDINSARHAGGLSALYDKADKLIIESRGSTKEELMGIQSQIAGMLVEDKKTEIDKVLQEKKTEHGLVDRSSLTLLLASVAKMKVWDFKRYSVIVPSLKNMLDKTNHEIAE